MRLSTRHLPLAVAALLVCAVAIAYTPFGLQGAGARGRASTSSFAGALDPAQPRVPTALDSGNTAYRAGRYAQALAHYQTAAAANPRQAAPYFGVRMAALKLGNATLAERARVAIHARVDTTAAPPDGGVHGAALGGRH